MFSFFEKIMSDVTTDKVEFVDTFKQEAPIVQQKRQEALAKMKEQNRVSMLDGGKFSRQNTVLVSTGR